MAAASLMNPDASYSSYLPEIPKADVKAVAFLGSGAFGMVYKAKHEQHDELAIKICHRRMSEDKMKLVHREVVRMMKVSYSSNIVQIRGIISETGPETGPAIAMELMEHGSLRAFQGRLSNLPSSIKVKMMKDVALGMNYLHMEDPPIIHRDLKLDNIFVGRGLVAKIGDLGLATWSTASNFRQVAGTLTHIAPEILEDLKKKEYSKKSDVYSFGITLWELSTGKVPYNDRAFQHNDKLFVLAICGKDKRPSLEYIPDGEPDIVKDLMQESWNKEPSKRPSFQEIKERLTTYIEPMSKRISEDTAQVMLQLQVTECDKGQSMDGVCLFPWECQTSNDHQESVARAARPDTEERPEAGSTPSSYPLSLKSFNAKETKVKPVNHPQQESSPPDNISEDFDKMTLEPTIQPETVFLHKTTVPSQPTDDKPESTVPTYSLRHHKCVQETEPHDPSAADNPARPVLHSLSVPSHLSNPVPVAASAHPGFPRVVSAPDSFAKVSTVSAASQEFPDLTDPLKPVTERDIWRIAPHLGQGYKKLGGELGLSQAKIENIQADSYHNQEEMGFQVVLQWQRSNKRKEITRRALAHHLANVGLNRVVEHL